jgi:hypothetical protein
MLYWPPIQWEVSENPQLLRNDFEIPKSLDIRPFRGDELTMVAL